jgi:hypothetical protein
LEVKEMDKDVTHTNGPWHVVAVGNGQSIPRIEEANHWNIYSNSAYVCQVKREGHKGIQLQDARLIAAAPELKKALRWLKQCAEAYTIATSAKERDHIRPDVDHALQEAAAILASLEEV